MDVKGPNFALNYDSVHVAKLHWSKNIRSSLGKKNESKKEYLLDLGHISEENWLKLQCL